MTRADAASLITCGVFVAGILTGVNPGNAQPWVGMEGFRVEASHDGLALSDEEAPSGGSGSPPLDAGFGATSL